MNEQELKQLNLALKGTYMAIESFDHFIQDCQDTIEKDKLMEVQRHHKNQATRIADRIQQLGGKPVHSTGIAGWFSDIKHNVAPDKYYKGDILTTAIDGEKFGVHALKDILDDLEVDEDKVLLKDIMNKNLTIVEDLTHFQR